MLFVASVLLLFLLLCPCAIAAVAVPVVKTLVAAVAASLDDRRSTGPLLSLYALALSLAVCAASPPKNFCYWQMVSK